MAQVAEHEAATAKLHAAQDRSQVLQQRADALAASLAAKTAALQDVARQHEQRAHLAAAECQVVQQQEQQQEQQQPGQLLACLQGDPAALRECSLAQLYR